MLVNRRPRPSQVGCGLTTARRRLLHTKLDRAQPRATPPDQGLPSQATMVEIGFVEARESLGETPRCARGDRQRSHLSIGFGSSERGW